jgi:hypothetical protein
MAITWKLEIISGSRLDNFGAVDFRIQALETTKA